MAISRELTSEEAKEYMGRCSYRPIRKLTPYMKECIKKRREKEEQEKQEQEKAKD